MSAVMRSARRTARILVLIALLAGVVVTDTPALACSCAPTDLERWFPEARGAFVGTFVDRQQVGEQRALITFEVERVLKGTFGPRAAVRTNASGASCGLELLDGPRIGLLLDRGEDGVWESSLCQQVEPDELLAFAGDGHPPDPDIAPAGAATSPVWTILGVAALAALVLLVLSSVRRHAASRDGSAVT